MTETAHGLKYVQENGQDVEEKLKGFVSSLKYLLNFLASLLFPGMRKSGWPNSSCVLGTFVKAFISSDMGSSGPYCWSSCLYWTLGILTVSCL